MKNTGKMTIMSLLTLVILVLSFSPGAFSWTTKDKNKSYEYNRQKGYRGGHQNHRHSYGFKHRDKGHYRSHGSKNHRFRHLNRRNRHFRYYPRHNRNHYSYGGRYYSRKDFSRGNHFSFSFKVYPDNPYPGGANEESYENYRELRLFVQPAGADIFLDGQYLGKAGELYDKAISVKPGRHRIKLLDSPYHSYFSLYVSPDNRD